LVPSTSEAAGDGTGPDLLVQLAQTGQGPLRRRLRDSLREAISSGRLPPGSRLPSSRTLAADLGVSRGVVVEAYAQLTAEGFLISRPGWGTAVAEIGAYLYERGADMPSPAAVIKPAANEVDLRPGPPDLSTFPRTAWAKATRDVLRQVADADLGYQPPWGVDSLRELLTEYLGRVRGVTTHPSSVLVVSGATQGITLLVRVLRAAGVVDIAVEAPSNPVQRQVLSRYGLRVWDVPVDAEGLIVDDLARTPCTAVIVTPGHQYPCGMVLSASRRGALSRWADRVEGLVIEDDYDGMLRHDKRQVGALQMLSPARVALVGSVSKSLAPGLRLGWIVSPPSLVHDLRMAKRDDDFGTNMLEQYVLARLLATGDYDRHVRRLRRHYRKRRDSVIEALRREFPDAGVEGFAAGLHLLLRLPDHVDEERYVAAAQARGVAVLGTSQMYGTQPAQPGVVIQYGRVSPTMLEEAARRLGAAAVAAASAGQTHPSRPLAKKPDATPQHRPSTAVDYF
jgi:GntR family transcriptional regulator/MocR family aminotransferase